MNKLFRSRADCMVAGVCGGLGQYLRVDSTLVRLFFAFLTFYNLLGLWAYIVLVLIMPRVSEGEEEITTPLPLGDNPRATKIIGGGMVILGALALISNIRISWLAWFSFNNLWPVFLILLGVLIIVRVIIEEA